MSDWISVEDRLPGAGDVQVYCEDTGEQMVAFSLGHGLFQFGVYPTEDPEVKGSLVCRPSHWMLLPEPPSA